MDPRRPNPADAFDELISVLRSSLTPITTLLSLFSSPMFIPSAYSGEAVECSGFLLRISLYIEMQPQKFTTERAKVAFLLSLLSGRLLLCACAIWNSQSIIINSFDTFVFLWKFLGNLWARCPYPISSYAKEDQL